CQRHLLVNEEVLKFDSFGQSNRLKTVPRLPMPQNNAGTHLVRIEYLTPSRRLSRCAQMTSADTPAQFNSSENEIPALPGQLHLHEAGPKPFRNSRPQLQCSLRIARDPRLPWIALRGSRRWISRSQLPLSQIQYSTTDGNGTIRHFTKP